MFQKAYLYLSGALFGMVGLSHLIRAIYQIPVLAGDWEFPLNLSWAGGTVAMGLCFWGFLLARRVT
jgi:hypothetical protein